jgi:hypothetical protein
MIVLCMTVCRWYLLIVPVCVCVNLFFGHFDARRGNTSAACRPHVCYPVSELAIFRQGACRKRQALVGIDKALLETKRLCRQIYPLLRKTSVEVVYQYPKCIVGIKTTSICVSVFVVFCGTVPCKWTVD